MIDINDFYIGLRKINAIRIHKREDKIQIKEENLGQPINIGIMVDNDKKKIWINAFYKLSSIKEIDIEIDIEFAGHADLNMSFDTEGAEDITKSQQFKNFVDTTLAPKILKELDKILYKVYDIMNAEYKTILKQDHEKDNI